MWRATPPHPCSDKQTDTNPARYNRRRLPSILEIEKESLPHNRESAQNYTVYEGLSGAEVQADRQRLKSRQIHFSVFSLPLPSAQTSSPSRQLPKPPLQFPAFPLAKERRRLPPREKIFCFLPPSEDFKDGRPDFLPPGRDLQLLLSFHRGGDEAADASGKRAAGDPAL